MDLSVSEDPPRMCPSCGVSGFHDPVLNDLQPFGCDQVPSHVFDRNQSIAVVFLLPHASFGWQARWSQDLGEKHECSHDMVTGLNI